MQPRVFLLLVAISLWVSLPSHQPTFCLSCHYHQTRPAAFLGLPLIILKNPKPGQMFFISLVYKNCISLFSLHYDYHMTTRPARGFLSFPRFLSGNRQPLPSLRDFSSRSIKLVFSMFTAPLLLNQKVTFQRLRPQFSQNPSKWTHYFNNLPCQHHQ